MAVVIRLQGLRITAGSEDIRNFFTGLKIPDGGVHIIGGELEEAFIIFVSDEDARRAMSRSGGCIKGAPVNLLLSSKSEMQRVLEESTRQAEDNSRRKNKAPSSSRNDLQTQKVEDGVGIYLSLYGMPFAATEEDIRQFFHGLQVEDVLLMKNHYGMSNGKGLVKFATKKDAIEGMKRNKQYLGPRYVQIRPCSETEWIKACAVNREGFLPESSDTRIHTAPTQSRSPIRSRSRSRSPHNKEYCVLYENLSYNVEKRDIKALLQPVNLRDDQIFILDDKNTKSAVVVFWDLKDYCSGLAHHKETFLRRAIHVSPISKEKMVSLLQSFGRSREERRSSRSTERSQKNTYSSEKRCLYVRNLPFDVRKVEIMDFFNGFQLLEDRVILLRDETEAGLGEALVIFQTEKEAVMAQSLNGQRFLGSEVILTCITLDQMQAFGISKEVTENKPDIPRNTRGYGEPPRFVPDKRYPVESDAGPDQLRFDRRDSGVFESFEIREDYERVPRGYDSGPQQFGAPPDQQFDGPTCVKLLNLPSQIRIDEIYDFCYGYRVIPGSVSLQYDRNGVPVGSATVVFETHGEALTAIQELNGRPIGMRRIKIVFV